MTAADRSRTAAVVVVSTRASRGIYEDRTGPVIVDWLRSRAFETDAPTVVPDGQEVGAAIAAALALPVDLLITTGGTGVSPTDRTPEATAKVLTSRIPGFEEEFRRRGSATTPSAMLTRGLAGVAGSTFVVNLPGSTGGVRDGLDLLGEVVDHVLDQLGGGDHRRDAG